MNDLRKIATGHLLTAAKKVENDTGDVYPSVKKHTRNALHRIKKSCGIERKPISGSSPKINAAMKLAADFIKANGGEASRNNLMIAARENGFSKQLMDIAIKKSGIKKIGEKHSRTIKYSMEVNENEKKI